MLHDEIDQIVSNGDLRIFHGADRDRARVILDLIAAELGTTELGRGHTRIVRVTAPDQGEAGLGELGLAELVSQTAGHKPSQPAAARARTDDDVERGHRTLTELDDSCDRILLMIEGAQRLQPAALRYIQQACWIAPHLRVAFAGPEGLAALLDDAEFAALRRRPATELRLDGRNANANADGNLAAPLLALPWDHGPVPAAWSDDAASSPAPSVTPPYAVFPASTAGSAWDVLKRHEGDGPEFLAGIFSPGETGAKRWGAGRVGLLSLGLVVLAALTAWLLQDRPARTVARSEAPPPALVAPALVAPALVAPALTQDAARVPPETAAGPAQAPSDVATAIAQPDPLAWQQDADPDPLPGSAPGAIAGAFLPEPALPEPAVAEADLPAYEATLVEPPAAAAPPQAPDAPMAGDDPPEATNDPASTQNVLPVPAQPGPAEPAPASATPPLTAERAVAQPPAAPASASAPAPLVAMPDKLASDTLAPDIAAAARPPDPVQSDPPALVASPARMPSALAEDLLRRGDAMLRQGDVAAARLLYERAASFGFGRAATAMGKTFDAAFLARIGVLGPRPDPAQAILWYRHAVALGDAEARTRLGALEPATNLTATPKGRP